MPALSRIFTGRERVHLSGEADGQPFETDGFLRRDPDRLRLDWGSDLSASYRGWLQVKPLGNDSAEVTVHLTFRPEPSQEIRAHTDGPAPDEREIQQGLEHALKSIQNHVEGR